MGGVDEEYRVVDLHVLYLLCYFRVDIDTLDIIVAWLGSFGIIIINSFSFFFFVFFCGCSRVRRPVLHEVVAVAKFIIRHEQRQYHHRNRNSKRSDRHIPHNIRIRLIHGNPLSSLSSPTHTPSTLSLSLSVQCLIYLILCYSLFSTRFCNLLLILFFYFSVVVVAGHTAEEHN